MIINIHRIKNIKIKEIYQLPKTKTYVLNINIYDNEDNYYDISLFSENKDNLVILNDD